LKPWVVVAFFGVLVLILRLSAFFAATLEWDESLYLLVADQWVQGHPPYTTVWDTRPPGIYVLFAVGLRVFGHSVVGTRVLAWLFVTATCFFLYRIGSLFERRGWLIGLLAGTLYALATVNGGALGSNCEVFFPTFSTLAFAIVLAREDLAGGSSRPGGWRIWGLAGLVLGLGFEIKQNSIFDAAALTAFRILLFQARATPQRDPRALLRELLAMGIGFSLPFLAVTALFALNHQFDAYWFATFTATRRRTLDHSYHPSVLFHGFASQQGKILLFWSALPAALAYQCLAGNRGTRER
jgi:4-amino-4-deoxy-L-arabinose transferase-like glycosyltransferase